MILRRWLQPKNLPPSLDWPMPRPQQRGSQSSLTSHAHGTVTFSFSGFLLLEANEVKLNAAPETREMSESYESALNTPTKYPLP